MKPKIKKKYKRITENDIKSFENENNVKLPEGYKNFLLENNGGEPKPDFYITKIRTKDNRENYGVEKFLPLKYVSSIGLNDLYYIAEDGGGNAYCIGVEGKRNNQIFYAHHEYFDELNPKYKDLEFVSESFEEFINNFDYDPSISELELIFKKNDVKALEKLLDEGLDVNTIVLDYPNIKYSLLYYSMYKNKPKFVELLIKRGSEIKKEYIENSIYLGNLKTIKILFKYDKNILYNLKLNLLHKLCEIHYLQNIIDYFLCIGFDINEKDETGKTALDIAEESLAKEPSYNSNEIKGFKEIIKLLKNHGAKHGNEL